jgi:hypothetical protein
VAVLLFVIIGGAVLAFWWNHEAVQQPERLDASDPRWHPAADAAETEELGDIEYQPHLVDQWLPVHEALAARLDPVLKEFNEHMDAIVARFTDEAWRKPSPRGRGKTVAAEPEEPGAFCLWRKDLGLEASSAVLLMA